MTREQCGTLVRRLFAFAAARRRYPPWEPETSTRILGRRTAPFPAFLIPYRVPHGFTQYPSTDQEAMTDHTRGVAQVQLHHVHLRCAEGGLHAAVNTMRRAHAPDWMRGRSGTNPGASPSGHYPARNAAAIWTRVAFISTAGEGAWRTIRERNLSVQRDARGRGRSGARTSWAALRYTSSGIRLSAGHDPQPGHPRQQ